MGPLHIVWPVGGHPLQQDSGRAEEGHLPRELEHFFRARLVAQNVVHFPPRPGIHGHDGLANWLCVAVH